MATSVSPWVAVDVADGRAESSMNVYLSPGRGLHSSTFQLILSRFKSLTD